MVIDTASPDLGQVERVATGLDIPVDVLVDTNEQTAYVARERCPSRGANLLSRVDLASGQVFTVTGSIGQPVNLAFAPDQQSAYVVDLMNGQVQQVELPTGTLATTLRAHETLWPGPGAGRCHRIPRD